ncbi:unnamed protein product [Caenorhabditis auriculariae]|uniref:DNA repair endonuclease XPF n=1 Tax=Caenorhabditis auriculariae TaxID=2777116 RepID=A0A8S1HBR4_9PELO|nr:unnamed protein product [Caenorhabditis auriculariae]
MCQDGKVRREIASVEVKQEEPDVSEEGDLENLGIRPIGDEDVDLVLMPHGERYTTMKFLEQRKPTVIIMHSMSLVMMRQIEIYRACNPELHLQIYCLQYRDSTEESRYLEAMNRETLAFESLIKEQATLMIAREFLVDREDPPRIKVSTRQGGGRSSDLGPTEEDSQPVERPKIIVDMREFNSELPTVLYTKGYDVVAATLEVGDYVLSSSISIERKALDDLAQSLQSGRVFKQAEQMLLHYANSVLLIESNQKFEMKIVNGGPFQGELSRHCREIRARLCALIRAQPRLKCVWTMSPANSAEFFAELKLNSDEPDMDKAISLRGDHVEQQPEEDSQESGKKKKANPTIQRALTTHLGMKAGDANRLLTCGKVKNLVELFSPITSSSSLEDSLPGSSLDFVTVLSNYDFSAKMAAGEMAGRSVVYHFLSTRQNTRRLPFRRLGSMSDAEKVVPRDEIHKFMVTCMTKAGASELHARQLADVLVEGDVRGHYSHGLNRLDMYVRDVTHKTCKGDGEPVVLKERAATAWVDGNNLLGPVVGNFCMNLAVEKAKEAGVGWVVAKGSNHYGIAGWYALQAMKSGMLGMSMTNTSPISFPTRSAVPALGTNPLSLGAPAAGNESFVLDMATTTVAVGKASLFSLYCSNK